MFQIMFFVSVSGSDPGYAWHATCRTHRYINLPTSSCSTPTSTSSNIEAPRPPNPHPPSTECQCQEERDAIGRSALRRSIAGLDAQLASWPTAAADAEHDEEDEADPNKLSSLQRK